MVFAWLLIRKTGNGGLADIVWTLALGATMLFFCYAVATPVHGHDVLAALIAILWTIRLGLPLWRRNVGGPEDARYTALRRQWGDRFMPRLFGFLIIQAVAALPLALTGMIAARNPLPLGTLDALGVLVMAIGLWGGHVADSQLARFKKDPSQQGKICDVGLWSRSRHPNYFFETMFWSGWPLLALSGGELTGAFALMGPVFIYLLLRYVSGEPLVEQHMARRYGDAFTLYCRRVPPFFPRLFPK
jgi:steroid 5-alpha reductase family enzyme